VVRLGISLEPDLRDALDAWVRRRNSRSRSEGVRALIRRERVEQANARPDADVVGTVTVLYRHDTPNVLDRLAEAQHRWGSHLRCTTHVHLEGGACLEAMILLGRRHEVEAAADDLRGVKGVTHGGTVLTSPAAAGGSTGHAHPHAGRHRRRGSRRGRRTSRDGSPPAPG
jgi:CopG family transcriptional regulator, nickel-responsive regulator